MLFPKLKGVAEIFNKEHPVLHPDSMQYLEYWRQEKMHCIEGKWKETEVGHRFVPPTLYFYGTACKIPVLTGNRMNIIKPYIQDTEWIMSTALEVCKGFSGWENAPFTCLRAIKENFFFEKACHNDNYYNYIGKELERKEVLSFINEYNIRINFPKYKDTSKPSKEELEIIINTLFDLKNNEYYIPKKYIDALDALKICHDVQHGKPLYSNSAKSLTLLGTRGLGKTLFIASVITHYLLFDGAVRYDEYSIENPSKIKVGVASFNTDKTKHLIKSSQDIIKELPGKYGTGDTYVPAPFFKQLEGQNEPGKLIIHTYRVKENGTWVTKGSQSSLVHKLVLPQDKEPFMGHRLDIAILEEFGSIGNARDAVNSLNAVQKIGNNKYGFVWCIGTGGNIEKVAESQNIFYNPKDYGMLSFPDLWENGEDFGLFIPYQYAFRDYKDEDGNTDFETVNNIIKKERNKLKWDALVTHKMHYPIVPSEMFLSTPASLLPTEEIAAQIRWVEANQRKINTFTVHGTLSYDPETDYGVSFTPDLKNELVPIKDFPLRDGSSLKGCVTIYEFPPEIIPTGLFKVTYDPVRDDNIEKMSRGVSLGAAYVYKAVQNFDGGYDELVACYVGREKDIDNMHEIVIKLAMFYNAKIMPEMNLNGFYKHLVTNKRLFLLAPTPFLTIGKINSKIIQRYSVGIKMTLDLIIQAEQYLARWLLKEKVVEYDKDGNPTKTLRNVNFIYDKALLNEMLLYNRTINTDRVSALLILMLWLEETVEQKITQTPEENTTIKNLLKSLSNYGKNIKRAYK